MEKIWLQSYQAGVQAEVDVRRYASIGAVFRETVEKFGHQPGFTNMGVVQTYAETAALVDQFASYLQNMLHIQKGDRVAVMHDGQLSEACRAEDWTREAIGLAMAGATPTVRAEPVEALRSASTGSA